MRLITTKNTKFFLLGISILFLVSSLFPSIRIYDSILPLIEYENQITDKKLINLNLRTLNAELKSLENLLISDTNHDLFHQWKENQKDLINIVPNNKLVLLRLNSFENYYKAKTKLGKENHGYVGLMRIAAHQLETSIKNNIQKVSYLLLRRHEKDFLLRETNNFIIKFDKESKKLEKLLRSKKSLRALNEYKLRFKTITELARSKNNLLNKYQYHTSELEKLLKNKVFKDFKSSNKLLDEIQSLLINLKYLNISISFVLLLILYGIYRFLRDENKIKEKILDDKIQLQQELLAQEKLASLGSLTAGIAHEIKNPLNIILNFAKATNEIIDDSNQSKNIDKDEIKFIYSSSEHIIKNSLRLQAIVNNMLRLARSNDREKTTIKLNELIRENYSLAYQSKYAMSPFEIELTENIPDDIDEIECYAQDLAQAFINIFENSFYALQEKAKTHSDFKPKILISLIQDKDVFSLCIKDNGVGIAKEDLDKMMEPFFTTKPPGEGTGLGLSFTFDAIKEHYGTISVHSVKDQFTQINITLPRYKTF